MVRLTTFGENLIVFGKKAYLISSGSNGNFVEISVNEHTAQKSLTLIDCVALSPCSKFVALTAHKEIFLFALNPIKFIQVLPIEKTASSVRFFNSLQQLLVADRSGTVSFFSFSDGFKKLPIAFGHNSMLTDVIISSCDKYVISADRDEKIKVSCYPNVYNIHQFCLGHEQFVSSLCFVKTSEGSELLASSSGDGTVRIWNYEKGKELALYSSKSKDAIVKIVSETVCDKQLIVAHLLNSPDLEVISVSMEADSMLQLSTHSIISCLSCIIDVSSWNSCYIYLCEDKDNPIHFWPNNDDYAMLREDIKRIFSKEELRSHANFDILFKREFDNVEEYQKKKKARLSKQIK